MVKICKTMSSYVGKCSILLLFSRVKKFEAMSVSFHNRPYLIGIVPFFGTALDTWEHA